MSRYRPGRDNPKYAGARRGPAVAEPAPQLDLWGAEPQRPDTLTAAAVEDLLAEWVEAGWLRALDLAFARFVTGGPESPAGTGAAPLMDTAADDAVAARRLLLAALLSHQVGRGHVCLDLGLLVDDPEATLALPPEGYDSRPDPVSQPALLRPSALLQGENLSHLREALSAAPAVAVCDRAADDHGQPRPLVLSGRRLYLYRYWQYEQQIAAGIRHRLRAPVAVADPDSPEAARLRQALSVLFDAPARPASEPDYQKAACALAARHRFAVITGGPGTGKTTTVVRLLAALQSGSDRPLRIRLAAPTGKAAARLSESISNAVSSLPLGELPGAPAVDAIPTRVTTLHRLLGSLPGSRRFRHNPDNPLPVDLLVIDEASMVDVDLMAQVFDALPASASLILLGDKDQLASVDAGAVLGELCQRAAGGHYRPETASWLMTVSGQQLPPELQSAQGRDLDQAIAMLRVSHRFGGDSGIGVLAAAVNEERLDQRLSDHFRTGGYGDVAWLTLPVISPEARTRSLVQHCLEGSPEAFGHRIATVSGEPGVPVGYRHYLEVMKALAPGAAANQDERDQWARAVLEAFNRFQVLCALRKGPFGVEGVNEAIALALREARLIDRTDGWYAGRPVLVTGNDYNLGLMNGDVGITLRLTGPEGEPMLRVAFPSADASGAIHWVSPGRLQSVETVYAMTVHKSQGSEFGHTCLLIPDRLTPVLTRELIYTGITRARHWLSLLVTDPGTLHQAVSRAVVRASGLAVSLE